MVLEWTLEPTPGSILVSAAASVTSQGNMGDSEPPHQTFCVSLVLVSFTLSTELHTPRSSHLKREPQRFQATSYWVLEDQGTGVSV